MNKSKHIIIACGSIKSELKNVCNHYGFDVDMFFMPQNLHRNPENLTQELQKTINKESPIYEMVVLGYGLCSGGTAGLKAPDSKLAIPRIHDCMSMYLGNKEEYNRIFKKYPGTYFLTKSWIDNKVDPLGLVNNEYKQRVGSQMAMEAMETELKNYSYIAYIKTPGVDNEKYRNVAIKNAEVFNKQFIEIKGSDEFFKKLLSGPYDNNNFLIFNSNQTSNQNHFLK